MQREPRRRVGVERCMMTRDHKLARQAIVAGSGGYIRVLVIDRLGSSSTSSSMFISRPTPLRAYAVLILDGTPPLMTKLNSLAFIRYTHQSYIQLAFPLKSERKNACFASRCSVLNEVQKNLL